MVSVMAVSAAAIISINTTKTSAASELVAEVMKRRIRIATKKINSIAISIVTKSRLKINNPNKPF
jgi:hypothetical protein